MSELVHVSDFNLLEGVVIETGQDLVPFGHGHNAPGYEEVTIEGTVSPRDEWAQHLVSQNIITDDIDLSLPIEDCRCQTPNHIAFTSANIIKDSGRTELVAELPYPLTSRPVTNRFDPYGSPNYLSDSGLRLAYLLYDAPGMNSITVDRYSVSVQVARAFDSEDVLPSLETSLRASGCDQLTSRSAYSADGYGNYL